MKILSKDKAILRRRILRFNVLLGLMVFAVAVFFNITGEYGSLAERNAAESVYNMVAVSGVLFSAFSWMFCVMSKPFWFPGLDGNKAQ
jgi:hypothetical protein